jgi:hypothetical protein
VATSEAHFLTYKRVVFSADPAYRQAGCSGKLEQLLLKLVENYGKSVRNLLDSTYSVYTVKFSLIMIVVHQRRGFLIVFVVAVSYFFFVLIVGSA